MNQAVREQLELAPVSSVVSNFAQKYGMSLAWISDTSGYGDSPYYNLYWLLNQKRHCWIRVLGRYHHSQIIGFIVSAQAGETWPYSDRLWDYHASEGTDGLRQMLEVSKMWCERETI